MIRFFRYITLVLFIGTAVVIPSSCQGPKDPEFKMLIITQIDSFTGYFMLNTDTYDFSDFPAALTSKTNTAGKITYYFTLTLNDLMSADKMKTLNVSAIGSTSTTAIDFYLYKDDDLIKDVHDTQTTAGYVVKISFTGFSL